MAKKLSNDYRIWIESVTPGTYNEIKGNQNLSISRDGGTIDTSTKSDFPWGTQAPGLRQTSIQASFVPDLPDANGYTRLETLANASVATPFNIQIRKGGAAATSGDAVFTGSVYATQNNTGMDQNSPVSSSWTLVLAAAPTTDLLS